MNEIIRKIIFMIIWIGNGLVRMPEEEVMIKQEND